MLQMWNVKRNPNLHKNDCPVSSYGCMYKYAFVLSTVELHRACHEAKKSLYMALYLFFGHYIYLKVSSSKNFIFSGADNTKDFQNLERDKISDAFLSATLQSKPMINK